jgi:hypothetical protein
MKTMLTATQFRFRFEALKRTFRHLKSEEIKCLSRAHQLRESVRRARAIRRGERYEPERFENFVPESSRFNH